MGVPKKARNLRHFCGKFLWVTKNTPQKHGGFRVRKVFADRCRARKARVLKRLDRFNYPDDMSKPMLRGANVGFELAGRVVGTAYGGIGLVHQLVQRVDLAGEINQRLSVFKIHLPYFESDHVLNLVYNTISDGRCLEDWERRRQDEGLLNMLGALRLAMLYSWSWHGR
jgi:hypothetical protein